MRFLHVEAPQIVLSEDLNLGEELILDTSGSVSLQTGPFSFASRLRLLFIESLL